MADRNRYKRQENRDDSERGYRQGRQPEQFQSERSSRDEDHGSGSGQMGDDYSQGRYGDQENDYGAQNERSGSSWRDEGSYQGGRDYKDDYGSRSSGGGGYGPARYDNNEQAGFGSFNSENYGSGNVGRREGRQGYGRGQSMQGGYSGGSHGAGTSGLGGNSRGRDDRGFFDKAGDEVASWFGDDDAARRRERDHRGRGPSSYTRSDDRILEDACDRLTEDWGVDARNVQVTVQGGELTLDGTVDDRQQKRRAEDCVHEISGVGHVQNNLRTTDNVRDNDDRTDRNRSDTDRTMSERNTGTLA